MARSNGGQGRLAFIDSVRGFAMLLMAVFHFCFDLGEVQVLHQDFRQGAFWVVFRAIIMSLFMGLVGVGFYLGSVDYNQRKYWRRLIKIVLCAGVISLVTHRLFPRSWIFFGVLHFVAVATLLGPLLRRLPVACLPVGIAIISLPRFYSAFWLYQPGWNLLGLSLWLPLTDDFAPITPWLGVTMVGVFVGWAYRKWLQDSVTQGIAFLAWLGRHALPFYLLHQLALFPLALLISKL